MDLFPYSQLWRINRAPTNSNKCGVIASILIFMVIGGLLVNQLLIAFSRTAMTYTTEVVIDDFPVKSTVSTNLNVNDPEPFMIGIDVQSGNQGFNTSTLNITAYINGLSGSQRYNRTQINTPITLEKCTSKHFSSFPNIQIDFSKWKASNWWCLPLNQAYTIQGSWALNGNYSSIDLQFNCSGSCTSYSQGLNIYLYALSTILNPNNSTKPEQHSIDELFVSVQPNKIQHYSYSLTENILKTDKSLLPWEDVQTSRSWQLGEFKRELIIHNQNYSSSRFYIQRSSKTVIISRQYMKLLQVFSYIGGNFQALLGAFFFMAIVGRIFFEFKFAKKLFKSQIVQNFGAKGFVTQITYKFLTAINFQPDWKQSQKREQMQETVNNLLDIPYLQKRIDFLETALSVMLEQHQLEALYLCQDLTKAKTDQTYKRYQFRDRLVLYFRNKKDEILQSNDQNKPSQSQHKIRRTDEVIGIHPPNSLDKDSYLKKTYSQIIFQTKESRKKLKGQDQVNMSEQIIRELRELGDRKLTSTTAQMKEAFQKVQAIPQNILKAIELKEWIANSFQRLLRDVKQSGDWRSKKIYYAIEEWLRILLEEALRDTRRDGQERRAQLVKQTEVDKFDDLSKSKCQSF